VAAGTAAHGELGFDDLTAPVLADIQRQIRDHTESRVVGLDVERMVAEAVATAQADDFAPDDGFWDRVHAYVGAIEADDGLKQLIRGTLRQRAARRSLRPQRVRVVRRLPRGLLVSEEPR
jgi:hypothetical protein